MQWKNEWGGEILFLHGRPNSCGTVILIRNNTNYSVLSTTRYPLGRFIILKIQIDDKVYVLVNIYAPNKDKDLIQFFSKITWNSLNGSLKTSVNFRIFKKQYFNNI